MTDFRKTKIRILSEEHSKAFQDAVFAAGGKWLQSGRFYQEGVNFIFLNNSLDMTLGETAVFFEDHDYKEIQFPLTKDAEDTNTPDKLNHEWDGKGVPPVGTVCEFLKHAKYRTTWIKVRVVFIGVNLIVFEHGANGNEFSEQITEVSFRPIKTPDQIAAEERERVITDMYTTVMESTSIGFGVEALYDAGYRKIEVKE